MESALPPPPPFARLYTDESRQRRDVDPIWQPPPPPQGYFYNFGEIHSVRTAWACRECALGSPLTRVLSLWAQGDYAEHVLGEGVDDLAGVDNDGLADLGVKLRALNMRLPLAFCDVLRSLARQPEALDAALRDLNNVLSNMNHLLNRARAHQARATVAEVLRAQIADRNERAAQLEQ
jgi:hypothetical protein